MPKELERDLGLYATITVSIGAMVGSGIFVLPGLAAKMAGPAAIVAYLLAGVIVLPAALSKAEMATAMPESGGTYLYIDRAMGPLLGTIAGIGSWFSLVFKSAFALVGLGAYLLLLVDVPAGAVTAVALTIAGFLLVVNFVGVKQTGRLQSAVVTLVLVGLMGFIADGLTYVDQAVYHPFFPTGADGVLEATGFVFVSYAGVTKIASVAEEVENPGRNIPIGILGSVVVMMFVYTFVVFVVVGVFPGDAGFPPTELATTLTPMALAAQQFLGVPGRTAIAVIAALALASMANAGVLSSSRFPFAMSRDDLAPARLGEIHPRFRTPVVAIALTGVLLVVLIAFVPVEELAKLASAFKILIFSLVNIALVTFRESGLESYDPEFVAPGYPWVQLFGLLGGLLLLTQMGPLPLAGAVGIVAAGAGWYRLYGREKTAREGAALDAIRRTTDHYAVEALDRAFETSTDAVAVVDRDDGVEDVRTNLAVAGAVAARRGGDVTVTHVETVPEQVTLSSVAAETESDRQFERGVLALGDELGIDVDVQSVVSHDAAEAVQNHVRRNRFELVFGKFRPSRFRGELLGEDVDWYMRKVRADFVFTRDRGLERPDQVAVVGSGGPYDPLEVVVADAVAAAFDARLTFVHPVSFDAQGSRYDSVEDYLDAVEERCLARTDRVLVPTDDRPRDLPKGVVDADLVVTSTAAHHLLYDVVFGTVADALATELDATVLLVHADSSRRGTVLRYFVDRVAF